MELVHLDQTQDKIKAAKKFALQPSLNPTNNLQACKFLQACIYKCFLKSLAVKFTSKYEVLWLTSMSRL